jgi:hypothetical protein
VPTGDPDNRATYALEHPVQNGAAMLGVYIEGRSRSLRRAVLVVAAIAAIVIAAWFVPRAFDRDARKESGHHDRTAADMARTRNARNQRDPNAPATCWTGLDRFDEAITLDRFRDWAGPLVASGDPLVVEYLVDRLAELIGDDEPAAHEVLAWIRDAAGDELFMLCEGLERAPAMQRPAVAEAVAKLALDPTLDDEHRTALVGALDTQKQLAPGVLDGLAGLATTDEPGEAGWLAARTVGRVMLAEVGRGGDATPYVERLLAIGGQSPDAQVRSVALEMPMHADVPVDSAMSARLASIVTSDPDLDVRMTAIHDLSIATDRDQTLQIYENAFRVEQDVCVRWALFRFTARVAGARALTVMARMALIDPRFAPDLETFNRIYSSGVVDFERVWQSLPDDDPHHCLHVEGEGEDIE